MNLSRIVEFACCLIVLLLTVIGCEYNTDKIYYREINPNASLPDLTVYLNLNADTVYLYSNPKVKLSLTLTNKTLLDVKFYLNEAEVGDVYNDNNEYYFFIDASRSDQMTLRAEIYTTTGTGSIADALHAESFLYTTGEWVLIPCRDNLKVSTAAVDGRLKLSWTPIRSASRCRYYIYSSGVQDSTYENWYIDSNYFGGSNFVYVTYADDGLSGYQIFLDMYNPFPEIYLANRDSFLIKWDKSAFYNNIKGYEIRIDTFVRQFAPSDTFFTFKNGYLGYPTYVEIGFLVDPDQYSDSYYPYNYVSDVYPASFLGGGNYSASYFPLTGSAFYYWVYDQTNHMQLKKFSLDSKTVINSLSIGFNYFAVSPNDKYILCDAGEDLKLLDPNGLNTIRVIPVSHILNNSTHLNMNFIVSDIGTSVFVNPMSMHFKIYDLVNDSLIDSIPLPPDFYSTQYKLSADGKYLFDRAINILYRIENNTHSIVWSNEGERYQYEYYSFSPGEPDRIYLSDGTNFYIKDCSDFSTIMSFPLDHTVLSIDFVTSKILAFSNNTFYVYSLTDGGLLNSIPTYTMGEYSYLFNDYLLSHQVQVSLKTL
jgi:hypothetical protein